MKVFLKSGKWHFPVQRWTAKMFGHLVLIHGGENTPKSELTCFKNHYYCFSKLPFKGLDIVINSIYTPGVVILCH